MQAALKAELAAKTDRVAELEIALEATTTKLAACDKERKVLAKRSATATQLVKALQDDLVFTKQLNTSLTTNQQGWEERVAALDAKLAAQTARAAKREAELEEQVADLMFSLDTQAKVESMADKDEVRAGAMIVTEPSGRGAGRGRGSRGRRRGGKK